MSHVSSVVANMTIPFKEGVIHRRVRVFPVGTTWDDLRVNVFRNYMDVSVADLMMQRFYDVATEAFISFDTTASENIRR